MNTLFPPELWSVIFAMACTDGGRTGCALSLVSRDIRAVSCRLQMQSVAVQGMERMSLLLGELRRRSPSKRLVRHLIIAAIWPTNDSEKGESISTRDLNVYEYHEVTLGILEIVGPSLQTLTLPFHGGLFNLGVLLKLSLDFPLLHSLTINGRMAHEDRWKAASDIIVTASLPRLERVHLFKGADCSGIKLLLGSCKQITHIRIAAPYVGGLLPVLWDMLQIAPFELQDTSCNSSLRYLTVVPECMHAGATDKLCRRNDDGMKDLEELQQQSEGNTLQLLLSPGRLCYGDREAKRDWLDVVDGGVGCWVTTKEELAARAGEVNHEFADLVNTRLARYHVT